MAHGRMRWWRRRGAAQVKTPSDVLASRAALIADDESCRGAPQPTFAVPEFFHMSEEGSDGVQDGEAVGMDVCVVSLERVSDRSTVSGLQRHPPNIEHAPSLDVPMLQVCRDGGRGGGLQGFFPRTGFNGVLSRWRCRCSRVPGQCSTAFDRDEGAGGGLQDFLRVQGSEAVFGGRGPGGRPRGFVPRQSSSSCGATPVEQVIDVPFGRSQNSIPQRAVLRAPQMAEQLVEVHFPVTSAGRRPAGAQVIRGLLASNGA